MRKKRILALLLSLLVLSGCGRISETKVPEFSYFSTENNGNNSEQSDSSLSEESSGSESSFEEDSTSQEENSREEPVQQETKEEYKIVLDEKSERTIVCDGKKLVLTGKGDFKPSVNIPCSETYEKSGDGFVYTAEIKSSYTGYGNVSVFPNVYVRIYADKDKVSFVQDAQIIEANEKTVKNAIDQPLNQVADYIAINADKEKTAEILGEITTISNRICEGLDNDYDKLRAISLWVSTNIYYDYIAYDAGVPQETLTLEYMLKNASSVCGGYSNMTSALAAAQGIKVYNVHGSAVNNHLTFGERDPAYHEWNYAIIDGRVIWIDSGWNSHCVRNRKGRYVSGEVTVKYFDISIEALSQNHKAKYAEYRDYFALLEE